MTPSQKRPPPPKKNHLKYHKNTPYTILYHSLKKHTMGWIRQGFWNIRLLNNINVDLKRNWILDSQISVRFESLVYDVDKRKVILSLIVKQNKNWYNVNIDIKNIWVNLTSFLLHSSSLSLFAAFSLQLLHGLPSIWHAFWTVPRL